MTDVTLPSGIAKDELDAEVRPQDDLFRHVNGKWIERTEIPADKARYGSFLVLHEEAEQAVREIIEEAQEAEPGTEARKVGDLYASFMDEQRADLLGATPIAGQLVDVSLIGSVESFLETLGRLERQGVSGFLQLFVDNDPGDPERYLVFVEQGGIGLPDESYFREERFEGVRTAYNAHLERMFGLAQLDDPADRAVRVFDLETDLAKVHWDNVDTRDSEKTYNLFQWADAAAAASVDLQVWRDAMGVPEGAFDELVLREPSFVEGLGALLTEERLPAWKDWLAWQVIRSNAAYLSNDFVEANFDFYGRTLTGTPQMRERWKRGVSLVEGAMGEAVGRIYVERHFPPAAKEAMDDLVANLVEAYRQSITALDWMGKKTRAARARQAREVHAEDRLPREVARLLEARDRRRRPGRQRARHGRVRVQPRARQDRQADRPRRVVHDPADDQRVLQPGLQRDRVPRGDPAVPVLRRPSATPPRTTARSARSSATRSGTASTTRARSTTATGASPTGGPRPTAPRSRTARRRSSPSTTRSRPRRCPSTT